jgi:hypothetical protein
VENYCHRKDNSKKRLRRRAEPTALVDDRRDQFGAQRAKRIPYPARRIGRLDGFRPCHCDFQILLSAAIHCNGRIKPFTAVNARGWAAWTSL